MVTQSTVTTAPHSIPCRRYLSQTYYEVERSTDVFRRPKTLTSINPNRHSPYNPAFQATARILRATASRLPDYKVSTVKTLIQKHHAASPMDDKMSSLSRAHPNSPLMAAVFCCLSFPPFTACSSCTGEGSSVCHLHVPPSSHYTSCCGSTLPSAQHPSPSQYEQAAVAPQAAP